MLISNVVKIIHSLTLMLKTLWRHLKNFIKDTWDIAYPSEAEDIYIYKDIPLKEKQPDLSPIFPPETPEKKRKRKTRSDKGKKKKKLPN